MGLQIVKRYNKYKDNYTEVGESPKCRMFYIRIKNKQRIHRLDGPAIMWSNGTVEYWINDEYLTRSEFFIKTSKLGRILYS